VTRGWSIDLDARTLTAYLLIGVMLLGLAVLIARLRYLSPTRRNARNDTRSRSEERAHVDAMAAREEPPEER
jgi:hypothetical protein